MGTEAIDVFCGAGGLSLGLVQSGISVSCAIDCDSDSLRTYTINSPNAMVINQKIQTIKATTILGKLNSRKNLTLAGGPPCQLFSRLNRNSANNTPEVKAYVEIIKSIKPRFIVMENVPQILKKQDAWKCIVSGFEGLGYKVFHAIVNATDFGIAQRRKRLILIASKKKVQIPLGSSESLHTTVREAISHFPDESESIPNHFTLNLSHKNLEKIVNLRSGEGFRGKDESFCDSYSRMEWDLPSPTITTKCISFSNGRFGHPEFNRAITVREAATLQGFPESYYFTGGVLSTARQVGNAVPPPIGRAIGEAILDAIN